MAVPYYLKWDFILRRKDRVEVFVLSLPCGLRTWLAGAHASQTRLGVFALR
jgi:hypothetical protein